MRNRRAKIMKEKKELLLVNKLTKNESKGSGFNDLENPLKVQLVELILAWLITAKFQKIGRV